MVDSCQYLLQVMTLPKRSERDFQNPILQLSWSLLSLMHATLYRRGIAEKTTTINNALVVTFTSNLIVSIIYCVHFVPNIIELDAT